MLNSKALAASASAPKTYIEDVFSTYLYTGNGSTQTITNGIDLSGKGGLVWIKRRTGIFDHYLWDTARGNYKFLNTNSTGAEFDIGTAGLAFGSSGFTVGNNINWNSSTDTVASWTFRKAAKFFDVVTYTGNGTDQRAISHNLGSTPGFFIVKRTDSTGNWNCYHRSRGAYFYNVHSQ